MDYEEQEKVAMFVTGLLIGAVIGASTAILMAPQSGRRTRRRIQRAAKDVADSSRGRLEDLAEDVKDRVDDAFTAARKRIGS